MLLIATDEAGYGPKLGPLVIAATAWKIPGERLTARQLDASFEGLRIPSKVGHVAVKIDDSKAVFQASSGLEAFHAVVSGSHHWCGRTEPTLPEMLHRIASVDIAAIIAAPWLGKLSEEPFLEPSATIELLNQWRSSTAELIDVQARVITAERLNAACCGGANKADLLSESTVAMVRSLVEHHSDGTSDVAVYCDRHGGRRYYAGVLQHVFPEAHLQVIAEARDRSVYRLMIDQKTIEIAFTVKGESFTPVAFSSIHAKYLRERFMRSFNTYFASLHRESEPLRPTAGYPVDADRFLAQIAPILRRERIAPEKLVRSR